MDGQNWKGLKWIVFVSEKRRPNFFEIYGTLVYTCIKISFTQLENHSQLQLCGHNFANEILLVSQFAILNKIT